MWFKQMPFILIFCLMINTILIGTIVIIDMIVGWIQKCFKNKTSEESTEKVSPLPQLARGRNRIIRVIDMMDASMKTPNSLSNKIKKNNEASNIHSERDRNNSTGQTGQTRETRNTINYAEQYDSHDAIEVSIDDVREYKFEKSTFRKNHYEEGKSISKESINLSQ